MIRVGLLVLLLSGLLGAIRSRPYSNPFFAGIALPDCELPCFLGMRPGVSTLAEALSILQVNSRLDPASIQVIQSVSDPAEQSIIWNWSRTWSGLPEPVDSPSFILLRNGKITRIDLAVSLHMNDILAFAGQPARTFTVSRLEGTDTGWYYPAAAAFYLIDPACNTLERVPRVYAIQIRLVQDPEPFTDFGPWRGVRDWQRQFCH